MQHWCKYNVSEADTSTNWSNWSNGIAVMCGALLGDTTGSRLWCACRVVLDDKSSLGDPVHWHRNDCSVLFRQSFLAQTCPCLSCHGFYDSRICSDHQQPRFFPLIWNPVCHSWRYFNCFRTLHQWLYEPEVPKMWALGGRYLEIRHLEIR